MSKKPGDFTGNKGEWSEVYVLFKLLADGRLYAANADLEKIDARFYEIIKVFRKEAIGELIFCYDTSKLNVLIITAKGETVASLPVKRFKDEAQQLLNEINIAREEDSSSFKIVKTARFLSDLRCQKLKAPSKEKSDITIQIHDAITASNPILGFSIKSHAGKPPTLVNAGLNTNFVYEIIGGMTDSEMFAINALFVYRKKKDGIKKEISVAQRIEFIKTHGFLLKFVKINGSVFQNNLVLVDSKLPDLIAQLLLEYYLSGIKRIDDALDSLELKNPLGYDCSKGHKFYHYKFSKFLSEAALGMLPGKVWRGIADATGGYIVVKEDGEIVCYHLYNRNEFEKYLLMQTCFDRGGAGKHKFSCVEKKDDRYFIKLNLQVRFI